MIPIDTTTIHADSATMSRGRRGGAVARQARRATASCGLITAIVASRKLSLLAWTGVSHRSTHLIERHDARLIQQAAAPRPSHALVVGTRRARASAQSGLAG